MTKAVSIIRALKQKLIVNSSHFIKIAFSNKYLFWTNITISVTLSGLGDAIEQGLETQRGVIDGFEVERNINMTITGAPSGFIVHYWYKFLEVRMPGTGIGLAVKKMILDQIFCSPLSISSIFITLGVLENRPAKDVIEEIKEKFIQLYIAEWVVWPPAQFLNFYVIPLRYRVLFDSFISLGYDVYTSYVRYKNPPSVL